MFEILLTDSVTAVIGSLAAGKAADPQRLRKVGKSLRLLESDPHHPGLHSHRFEALDKEFDEKIWESYVENRSPSAWRIWWFFGPDAQTITVVALAPHP